MSETGSYTHIAQTLFDEAHDSDRITQVGEREDGTVLYRLTPAARPETDWMGYPLQTPEQVAASYRAQALSQALVHAGSVLKEYDVATDITKPSLVLTFARAFERYLAG